MSDTSTAKFKVVVLDDFEAMARSVPAYEKLKARADVTILRERLDTPKKIAQKLGGADGILLMRERTYFNEKELSVLPNLKFISQTGRTSRHIDLAFATRRGIAVAGTAADNGTSTKELTIGLILALMRKISQVDRRMREESWPPVAGQLLEGKTVGVLGFGRIGKEVAGIMKVFNTRVLAYSRTLTNEQAGEVVTGRALHRLHQVVHERPAREAPPINLGARKKRRTANRPRSRTIHRGVPGYLRPVFRCAAFADR